MFFTIAIITMTTWMTEELYLLVYAHRNTAEESFTHWYHGFFVVETLFYSNIITPAVVYFIFDNDFRVRVFSYFLNHRDVSGYSPNHVSPLAICNQQIILALMQQGRNVVPTVTVFPILMSYSRVICPRIIDR